MSFGSCPTAAVTSVKLYQVLLARSEDGWEAVLPNQTLIILFIPHGLKQV